MYKYNFENATEKRQADKELGYVLMPHPDGQVKHPEHLQQHETLQVLQRHALNGNAEKCKEMIAELPEHQRKDTIKMLKGAVREHGREIELEFYNDAQMINGTFEGDTISRIGKNKLKTSDVV
jgi:hypothetical protein|tara:strand:+ start:268 stop:636 length:369 start_codon:yes stop_codon:yes gene_type:complete